jgi:hypothetical protein
VPGVGGVDSKPLPWDFDSKEPHVLQFQLEFIEGSTEKVNKKTLIMLNMLIF